MTGSYKEATCIEGSYLAGGWRYRVLRVVKNTGEIAFTGLLSYDSINGKGEVRFICLSEYSTPEETRAAAYEKLPSTARALMKVTGR